MTRDELKILIKEEIRASLKAKEVDEGMLDRAKAKVKGAVAGAKGAVVGGVGKVMGKGGGVKQGTQNAKQKAYAKQFTGTYLKKIGKELSGIQSDFTKMLGLKSKDFPLFIKELAQHDPATAKMIGGIFTMAESLKEKLGADTK